jgi:hypothetical protein
LPKKFMLVVSIAALMVLALVSIAYAEASSGYAVWSSGGANAGTAATPHKDYRTTTVKCAVCHAVHKASGAAGSELLLSGDAGESCLFCHVDGGTGLVRIYAGLRANYEGLGSQYAHQDAGSGVQVGSRCTDCHAVHGANTMNDTAIDKFILKATASASGGPSGVATPQPAAWAARVVGDKQSQVDAFCSMCHPYAQYSYNGTITVDTYRASGDVVGNSGTFQSHVMTNAKASYANPARSIGNIRVAWIGSEHCRSCHDAGYTDVQAGQPIVGAGAGLVINSSYPHYTPNFTRFLYSAADSNAATTTTTYVPAGTASNTMVDGVCLKCHRSASAPATDGIGFQF